MKEEQYQAPAIEEMDSTLIIQGLDEGGVEDMGGSNVIPDL